MCVSGVYLCRNNGLREEKPVSTPGASSNPPIGTPASTAAPTPTSQAGTHQAAPMPPSEPRAQRNHDVWASIKLFSRRVAQNLRALIYTGRLRSTIVENFKNALAVHPDNGGLESQCRFYALRAELLNIGCKPEVVMAELESEPNYDVLSKNFKAYADEFKKKETKNSVAKLILSEAIILYLGNHLYVGVLSSHSTIKYMQRLLVRMRDDSIDVSECFADAWTNSLSSATRLVTAMCCSPKVPDEKKASYKLFLVGEVKKLKTTLKSMVEELNPKQRIKIGGGKTKRCNKASGLKNRANDEWYKYYHDATPRQLYGHAEAVRVEPIIEETLKRLGQADGERTKIIDDVAVMDKLMSSALSVDEVQIVVDKFIDSLFANNDSKAYKALAEVVQLFDGEEYQLPSEGGFIRLLSSRIQEKHKEKVNNPSRPVIPGEMYEHPI